MLVKIEMIADVDENKIDEIKKLEHHIEYLLALDDYPEIKSIFNVNVEQIKNEFNKENHYD